MGQVGVGLSFQFAFSVQRQACIELCTGGRKSALSNMELDAG